MDIGHLRTFKKSFKSHLRYLPKTLNHLYYFCAQTRYKLGSALHLAKIDIEQVSKTPVKTSFWPKLPIELTLKSYAS